jgi:hypothetical protein
MGKEHGLWLTQIKREVYPVMPLIQVVLVLIVVGVLLWLVNTYIPMAGPIKSILNAVVVIVVVLWLLNVFGLMDNLTRLRVGK